MCTLLFDELKYLKDFLPKSISAFKFGSDVQPSFGGKNLFGQPLKTEDKKTEESKPISSPLLAKGTGILKH